MVIYYISAVTGTRPIKLFKYEQENENVLRNSIQEKGGHYKLRDYLHKYKQQI